MFHSSGARSGGAIDVPVLHSGGSCLLAVIVALLLDPFSRVGRVSPSCQVVASWSHGAARFFFFANEESTFMQNLNVLEDLEALRSPQKGGT